jgi:hypothetical protein
MDRKYYDGLSGGIFLIGLGLLFLVPGLGIWPWILVVIACSQLPMSLARKQGWMAWQGFVWMVGLALLFASGFFFPGILIVLGVSALLGATTRQHQSSPFASKPSAATPTAPVVEDEQWVTPAALQPDAPTEPAPAAEAADKGKTQKLAD